MISFSKFDLIVFS